MPTCAAPRRLITQRRYASPIEVALSRRTAAGAATAQRSRPSYSAVLYRGQCAEEAGRARQQAACAVRRR